MNKFISQPFKRLRSIYNRLTLKPLNIHSLSWVSLADLNRLHHMNSLSYLTCQIDCNFSNIEALAAPHKFNIILRTYFTKNFSTSFSQDPSKTIMAHGPDGTVYAIPPKPLGNILPKYASKLKPSIIKSRLENLRSASLRKKKIRVSPWRLNLICQFAAGETVSEALLQLKYVHKGKASVVQKLVHDTAMKAKSLFGLEKSQLEIVECFTTQGSHLKRTKIMARGRSGDKLRRFSHAICKVREIDFPLKLILSKTFNQREKWLKRMEQASRDSEHSRIEKDELEKLEKMVKEMNK